MVLMGIRTVWRKDPDCSPAELVYGSSLRILGEFVEPTTYRDVQPSSAFLRGLQTSMNNALPPPVKYHSCQQTYSTCLTLSLQQDMYMFELMDIAHHSKDHRPDLFELSLPQKNTLH